MSLAVSHRPGIGFEPKGSGRLAGTAKARRNLVVVGLLLTIGLLVANIGWSTISAPATANNEVPAIADHDGAAVGSIPALREYVVSPGDSLWGIASRIAGDADPRPMLQRITKLNGLNSADVSVGTVILLPNGN